MILAKLSRTNGDGYYLAIAYPATTIALMAVFSH
jgi:hypothetical protein